MLNRQINFLKRQITFNHQEVADIRKQNQVCIEHIFAKSVYVCMPIETELVLTDANDSITKH